MIVKLETMMQTVGMIVKLVFVMVAMVGMKTVVAWWYSINIEIKSKIVIKCVVGTQGHVVASSVDV